MVVPLAPCLYAYSILGFQHRHRMKIKAVPSRSNPAGWDLRRAILQRLYGLLTK